jgi:hypothetical protein
LNRSGVGTYSWCAWSSCLSAAVDDEDRKRDRKTLRKEWLWVGSLRARGLGSVCDHMTVSLLEHVTHRIRVRLVIDARATLGLCFGVATVAQPSSADPRCRFV